MMFSACFSHGGERDTDFVCFLLIAYCLTLYFQDTAAINSNCLMTYVNITCELSAFDVVKLFLVSWTKNLMYTQFG